MVEPNEIDSILCIRCVKRPGTVKYAVDETSFVRGWITMMCPRCTLETQIAHAEVCEQRLPLLRAELAVLVAEDRDGEKK
jgi:hypothetical protein